MHVAAQHVGPDDSWFRRLTCPQWLSPLKFVLILPIDS